MFQSSSVGSVLQVNMGNVPGDYDQMNIICPRDEERHMVYSVTREEYLSCRLSRSSPRVVAVCDNSNKFMFFTITFRTLTPIPGALEFQQGSTHYFISTSSEGFLYNTRGGYCKSHHAKMAFHVAKPRAAFQRNQMAHARRESHLGWWQDHNGNQYRDEKEDYIDGIMENFPEYAYLAMEDEHLSSSSLAVQPFIAWTFFIVIAVLYC